VLYVIFSHSFDFDFLNTSQKIGREDFPKIAYLISSGTLKLNSVNQYNVCKATIENAYQVSLLSDISYL